MIKILFRTIHRLSWNTVLPIALYFIFILLVINFTFPLKTFTKISKYAVYNNCNLHSQQNITSESKISLTPTSSISELNILKAAFYEANKNNDQYLSIEELSQYINSNICKHINDAIKTNSIVFSKIDSTPKDGIITWEEYLTYFLHERKLNQNLFNNFVTFLNISNNNEENPTQILLINNLDAKTRQELINKKSFWHEAAKTDSFSLTPDEFLAFEHPESSILHLLSLVDDLMRLFDVDGDDYLTIDEFSDVTVDEIDKKYRKSLISKNVEDRRKEFRNVIDQNKDLKADREELLLYVDPRHPRYALQEATTLFNLTDINEDRSLSLQEILNNSKIFMSSKMICISDNFDGEF